MNLEKRTQKCMLDSKINPYVLQIDIDSDMMSEKSYLCNLFILVPLSGFSVVSAEYMRIFKPVSIQTMWWVHNKSVYAFTMATRWLFNHGANVNPGPCKRLLLAEKKKSQATFSFSWWTPPVKNSTQKYFLWLCNTSFSL